MIKIRKLNYRVDKESHILHDIELSVSPGDFVIILGGNGSGKSSLLKVLNKTYTGFTGDVIIDGQSLKKISKRYCSKLVSTLTQSTEESLFPELSIFENYILHSREPRPLFSLNADPRKRKDLQDKLVDYNKKLARDIDKQVSLLSGGEKQALSLFLCLEANSKVLLLDEHTSALDPKSAQRIMELTARKVKETGLTCIMTTHDLEYAQKYGNKLVALKEGRVVFSASNKAELNTQDLLKHCY